MALIIICGLPCSGKSSVASELQQALETALDTTNLSLTVIDEPSLHLHDRNDSYKNAGCEKRTRGQLKSAVERALSKKSFVILDSINCIKGYRYELHCVAKSAGTRYCMVHVDTPVERCRAMNKERDQAEAYSEAVFEDLAGRFERPDAKNRWDSPLFTIKVVGMVQPEEGGAGIENQPPVGPPLDDDLSPTIGEDNESEHRMEAVVRSIVAAMTGNASKSKKGGSQPPNPASDPPRESTAASSSTSSLLGEGGYPRASAPLTPSFATNSTPLLSTNTLHEMDQALQDVIDKVSHAQQTQVDPSGLIIVKFDNNDEEEGGGHLPSLQLHQHVSIAELRRHKRSFMKLATKVLFARLSDSSRARLMFIEYLRDNVTGCELIKKN